MKRWIIAAVVLVIIASTAAVVYTRRNRTEIQVQTTPLTRGDIVDTVGATGTLQAVTTVQVGSQVSGNIQWLGADFNSIVKQGQVIARLDPSLFEAQLQQVQANLVQARANLTKARSELDRARVQLTDAQQKYNRAQELSAKQLLAASEMDSAKVAVDTATAAVASQQASVTQAQAQVTQAEASVNQSQVNREHTVIVAPIDGIVTQRNVDVGQTVAASMQAPTLFIIAADLAEMQVNAKIDEADVGRIRPGQNVSFRVDAYPTDNFFGTVTQIRLQPIVVQNVTTYGAIITVPNRELKLKPGMTANLKIEIAKRTNALRIPNAALRFRPNDEIFAALNQTPPEGATGFGNGGTGGRGGRGGRGGFGGGDQGPAINASPTGQQASRPAGQQAGQQAGAGAGQQGDSRASVQPGAPTDRAGRGGGGFGGRPGGGGGRPGGGGGFGPGGGGPEFQARMMERFKTMSPDEQKQFIARMKERGGDTSAFEKEMSGAGAAKKSTKSPTQSATTIDALFAPLPVVESRGRAWLFIDHQLKPVNLRLGISDGQYTEVLGTELADTAEVVTGVTGLAPTRNTPQPQGTGTPFTPGRGGPGGPGGPGGGGFGGRG
jgi:HlyD family secretion protein